MAAGGLQQALVAMARDNYLCSGWRVLADDPPDTLLDGPPGSLRLFQFCKVHHLQRLRVFNRASGIAMLLPGDAGLQGEESLLRYRRQNGFGKHLCKRAVVVPELVAFEAAH